MTIPKLSRKARKDPLEKDIEKKVRKYATQKYGVLTRKFSSPNHRSVPDQILFWPNGRVTLIEFKSKGKKPTEAQWSEIRKIRNQGIQVDIVDSIEKGKQIIDEIENTFKTPPA